MKQTAVEYLAEALRFTNIDVYFDLYEIIIHAKEREDKQIDDAYIRGVYYKETSNTKEK
jgi:hypothetical protein